MPHFIDNGDTRLLLENDNVSELADKMKMLPFVDRFKKNFRERRDWYLEIFLGYHS